MPDETVVQTTETPPKETPPPVEAVDERGVPYKNVAAEAQRKLDEANTLNEQYKVALGQLTQQRQAAPPAPVQVSDDLDELEKQFDEPTRKYIDRKVTRIATEIAERTGYKFVSQAGVQTAMSEDAEVAQEARQQYAALATNPLWANMPDVNKQEKAVDAAKAVVLARRLSKGKEAQTEQVRQQAERELAAGGNLPGTRGSPTQQPKSKEEYIKTFMADQQNIADFRTAYGRKLDPFSPEGQKAFREAAEIAYDVGPAGMWGGKTAVATRILREEENRQ